MLMMRLTLIFAVACAFPVHLCGEAQATDPDPIVPHFAVDAAPALDALLQLSRSQHLSMGIVEDDANLCKSLVTYSAENARASTIIREIVAKVPGYGWQRLQASSIFRIGPVSPRPATAQFLHLKDDHFGPARSSLQTLETILWVHIRAILYPDQGTAGSILSSTDAGVYELEARDATVQAILDRMAVLAKGAWVLRPLPPTLTNLPGDIPYSIFSDEGQGDSTYGGTCSPVLEISK